MTRIPHNEATVEMRQVGVNSKEEHVMPKYFVSQMVEMKSKIIFKDAEVVLDDNNITGNKKVLIYLHTKCRERI